ncbi:MAG: dockerin type I domain-containing protein [Oscillospiraceae bacterium]
MKIKKIITVLMTAIIVLTALAVTAFAETQTGVVYGAAPDLLRVRASAGTKEPQLIYNGKAVLIADGTKVTILREVDSITQPTSYPKWFEISFDYQGVTLTGFVAKSYIKLDQIGPLPPPIEQTIPEIYKPFLSQVQLVRPNWKFEFYDTGLDWNAVLDGQEELGKSLIASYRPIYYRSKAPGAYDPDTNTWISFDAGGWYQANRQTIGHYVDPRNFMDEQLLFQFELLSYDQNTHTLDGVQKMLTGSFMENGTIYDGNNYITYAQAFMEAAKITGVSPYHLAGRVIQEVGWKGSNSVSGTHNTYPGIYNFYNINANSGADPISNALAWASSTNSNPSKNYMRPWNSQYKSIVGGALWIGEKYINVGQNTLYFQKFDVIPAGGLYNHQYMQNIEAPSGEAGGIYRNYVDLSALSTPFIFRIPLYNNMPSEAVSLPGSVMKGDVDCDGEITIADAMKLFQYVAGKNVSISANGMDAGDIDKNGIIEIVDAMKLFQFVAGKISNL